MTLLDNLPQKIVIALFLVFGMVLSSKLSMEAYLMVGVGISSVLLGIIVFSYGLGCLGNEKLCTIVKKLI